ncbi:pyruvate dehydrogenase (acetyl-transferring), homodimeric type [Corynebacterium massiliense]|uniref:Pyruvate dehydrogenase E1 component n=1 Tax=Corynebacterium massiliense DSM 45435 TaxID=1121364 RepID=A0ABY7U883_9CORY|nr:pyruvate dehydrogenase (acetyl-transferring), homodimeric type [Corynebacterium massiliense]WCZ32916.1 Pyruvate dehydrogenase E1 component [Corynebacterium massiliense DSM 45435]
MADQDSRNSDSTVPQIRDGVASYLNDNDPEETQEWMDSLDGLLAESSPERARYLMLRLMERATAQSVPLPSVTNTDMVNTIPTDLEPEFPGDEEIEKRYRRWIRWNAAIMVHRAQRPGIGVGGHISTYAGAAPLYEVGLNHFFRGKDADQRGDQIFFQGHASPGMYSRAFMEGRLSEDDLDGFRQEASYSKDKGRALPSYPHPRGMEDFWEFPTVSMGLGPANAIYQARFNKYLEMRGIKDTSKQHVWAFLGDGEMDEPESRGLLQMGSLYNLDNLTFIVNCNLQRLDGPVRGNTHIIQELESTFRGAGWNVIKVVWGRGWDKLFKADQDGALVALINSTSDGDYQTFKANDGAYVREHFFGRDERTAKLVEDMSDDEIWALRRGGHDYRKIYAAYAKALEYRGTGKPTVILAHTIKGYGLGHSFEGRNATHQMKKIAIEDLKLFRDKQQIPISDEELEKDPYLPPYYHPGMDAPEIKYMLERRKELGGFLPERRVEYKPLPAPDISKMKKLRKDSGKQEIATTMALVRTLKEVMRDKELAKRIVPIIPDEARTFGMDSWFPTMKIWNPNGQNYTPVDHDLMLSYREATDGQILHEGISEAGGAASFTAAATSYATHGEPMIPVYIYYAMFGFQRTGDAFWAVADQMGRGFLIGATAGRTTLTGEGLQHMDGHSLILASTNPGVVSYDPAFGYEVTHLITRGIDRMYGENPEDVIYYLTTYNEPVHQPGEPEDLDVEGLHRGIYHFNTAESGSIPANILASGVGMYAALSAQEILAEKFDVKASLFSVTSWSELARDAAAKETAALREGREPEKAFATSQLEGFDGPFVGVSDYATDLQEMIRRTVPGDYLTLGADGFGFADTREGARRFFNVDDVSIVVAVLTGLAREGKVEWDTVAKAAKEFKLDDPTATAYDRLEE